MITQEYVTPLFNLFVVPPEFKPRADLFPRYAFPHYNAGTDQAVKVTRDKCDRAACLKDF